MVVIIVASLIAIICSQMGRFFFKGPLAGSARG